MKHNRIHPLLPVLTILLLTVLFFTLFFNSIYTRLFNTYPNYVNERATLIQSYNENTEQLKSISTNSNNLSSYFATLTNLKQEVNRQIELINKIINLDLKYKKSIKNSLQIAEIQSNIIMDENRLNIMNTAFESYTKKQNAILYYNSVNDLSACLKSQSKQGSIHACESKKLADTLLITISNEYRNSMLSLFANYPNLNSTQKSKQINAILKYHNAIIKELESIINSSIEIS